MAKSDGLLDMSEAGETSYVRPLLGIAILQTLVVLGAGLNIYLPFTGVSLSPTLAVRWRELLSLGVIVPASTVLLFLAQRVVERGRQDTTGPSCLILLGFCWLATSMGVHEPINALWSVDALRSDIGNTGDALGGVLKFWDEVFSHVAFFAGYVTVSLALLWSQKRNILEARMGKGATLLFVLCAIPGGAGIYYSLAGTRNVVDTAVIAGVLIVAEIMRWAGSFRKRPLNILLEGGYLLAFVLLLLFD